VGEDATALIAAMPTRLAQQKKTAMEQPLPYFFAAPVNPARPL